MSVMVRRTRTCQLLVASLLLIASFGLWAAAPSSALAVRVCNDDIADGTTVKDSLLVPMNGFCSLRDVTVRGGVTVEAGAIFNINRSTIRGGLTANSYDSMHISFTEIRGNVTAIGGTGHRIVLANSDIRGDVVVIGHESNISQSSVVVEWSTIRGGLTVEDNATEEIDVKVNTVATDASISRNTAEPWVTIADITAGGRLDCFDNGPFLDVYQNAADGGVFGQCVEVP